MNLRRSIFPLVLAAAVFSATPSHAAVKPQIVDPKGDAVGLQGMHDIVSTTFEMTRTVKKVGKKSVVTPQSLVVTMKLVSAPSVAPGTYYGVVAGVTRCGAFELGARFTAFPTPGYNADATFSDCGTPDDTAGFTLTTFRMEPVLTIGSDSMKWTIPYKALPKKIRVGQVFFDLTAYTAPADPVSGISSHALTSIFGYDSALDIGRGDAARL